MTSDAETFEIQRNKAREIVAHLIEQGTDPIAGAQVLSLATGEMAARAQINDREYLLFVKELAEAILTISGVSSEYRKPGLQ